MPVNSNKRYWWERTDQDDGGYVTLYDGDTVISDDWDAVCGLLNQQDRIIAALRDSFGSWWIEMGYSSREDCLACIDLRIEQARSGK